jgi:hypothetical protein
MTTMPEHLRAVKVQLTVAVAARHGQKLAKVAAVADGRIIGVNPAPQAGLHRFCHVEADGLDGLMQVVQDAADIGAIIVRGAPRAEAGRRAIHDDPEKGPAGLVVLPRTWAALDFDGIPLRPHQDEPADLEIAGDPAERYRWAEPDPLVDVEIGVRKALRRLPPAFRDVSCGWQISASAGYKPGFRIRTWHLLNRACTGDQLKRWIKPAVDKGLIDDCTLTEAQPIYVSVTFIGGQDPCPARFGIFRQPGGDVVPVPDLDAIKRRQDEQERRERERNRTSRRHEARAPRGAPNGSLARTLDRCVEAVARAKEGQRHPTYLHQTARAKAICDKYGIEWPPWRDDLRRAYESTLTQTEISQRQRGSIDGVPDWFDRRSG